MRRGGGMGGVRGRGDRGRLSTAVSVTAAAEGGVCGRSSLRC
jgi:hypothetical protein